MKVATLLLSLFFLGTTDALSLSHGRTVRPSGTELSVVNRRAFVQVASVGAVAATLGSSPLQAMAADDKNDFVTTESGLQYKVTKEGLPDGAIPSPGQTVKTQYTGWLEDFDSEKKFDSSRDRNRPFSFKVGAGQVIRGWDESFLSMKVGERRQIIIPARLGYGDRGAGGIIPGGATLYFDVELLAIQ
jgi:peptidylprolyl isomerase